MLPLSDLQRAFLRAIACGDAVAVSADDPHGVTAEIHARGDLGARDRLHIYARMYEARLVDALAEDYPRVVRVLGWERFHEVARAYVAAHPSRHPSLRWLGTRFAEFLATTYVASAPGYVADLARLEWARVMVFDAPDVALLSVDALRRLPPEAWADLTLRLVPALEVLHVDWPAHEIWHAAETSVPPSGNAASHWLRVWRQGDRVYQAPMNAEERLALDHVRAGDDFGSLCAGLAAIVPAAEVAAAAGALVLRWLEDGLLGADDARS